MNLKRMINSLFLLSALLSCNGCEDLVELDVWLYPAFFYDADDYPSISVVYPNDGSDLACTLHYSLVEAIKDRRGYDYVSSSVDHDTSLLAYPYFSSLNDWDEVTEGEREIRYEYVEVDEYGDPIYDEYGDPLTYVETVIEPYQIFTRTAQVTAEVEVVRTEDNVTLGFYESTQSCSSSQEDPNYLDSYDDLYTCATVFATQALAGHITPTRIQISVREDDLLQIGEISYERFKPTSKVWKRGETITFEIWFPDAAELNTFQFVITNVKDRFSDAYFSQEIYWVAGDPIHFDIPVDELSRDGHEFHAHIVHNNRSIYYLSFKTE